MVQTGPLILRTHYLTSEILGNWQAFLSLLGKSGAVS